MSSTRLRRQDVSDTVRCRAFSASPSGPTASGSKAQGLTYASAGVSIDAGNQLVDNIKAVVKATARPGCDSVIGGFGGLFDLKQAGFRDPVLVSGTDGVGTKLVVAHLANKHDTVGASTPDSPHPARS